MDKLLVSVGLIVLGLLLGGLFRGAERKNKLPKSFVLPDLFGRTTDFSLLILNPIVIIGVFWNVEIKDAELAFLPILGILSLVIGGLVAIFFSKLQRLDRAKTGAMFVSGSFSNMGSFGTLFCFVIFGEESLAYVAMFRLLEELVYYTIGFPVAKMYGTDSGDKPARAGMRKLLTDPYIATLTGAMLAGTLLNISSWNRPAIYATVIEWSVPLFVLLLVTAIGYNLKISAIRHYMKPCLSIAVTKFLVVPVCMLGLAIMLNLGELHNGMVLGVVFILSAMPPAFTSLIPPQLYKLDVDLANSSWLFSSAVFILFVLPLLFAAVDIM